MKLFTCIVTRAIVLLIFLLCHVNANAQSAIKLVDFAVWGGSGMPSSYNSMQSVTLGNYVFINGKVGSNHLVDGKNFVTINGNIHSGNVISILPDTKITGNLFAENKSGSTGDVILGANKIQFTGNLTAAGKILLSTGGGPGSTTITGSVSVPAPITSNYSGPVPAGGVNTIVNLPGLPKMPNNIAFDNKIGTTNISNTAKISPGNFGKMSLTGNKTLTFDGPGNYIFYEVNNGGINKFVFDFKNTQAGTINIFVIKDALWGKLSVKTANGDFPSRIYTEVHGDGATNNGFSFDVLVDDPQPNNSFTWLGNVWAPNGGISVKNVKKPGNTTHIKGALWSGIKVDIRENIRLEYQTPIAEPIFIDPYYPPPPSGKVDAANNIIGAELLSLYQNTPTISQITENEIYRFNEAKSMVMIEVISKAPNDLILKAALWDLGMRDTVNNGPHIYTITGFFPIDSLLAIQHLQGVEYVRPLYPPLNNKGGTTTQGDTTQRSFQVRDRFNLNGEGVKIGVFSDSYNKVNNGSDLMLNVNEGDLPGLAGSDYPDAVQVLLDLPFGGHDEGRAMLQIIHDIAPKAKLAFRTGFLSAGDFANGILQMGNPNTPENYCDVLVDDITYPVEPFLRDGIVAQVVDQVVGQGVTYFSSAGNFGERSHEANFSGVLRPDLVPSPSLVHKFGPNAEDISQTINLKPGSYTIVLQWDENFHSVVGGTTLQKADLDLYILGTSGFPLFGFNRSNLFGDPFEVCPFTVTEETNAQVIIVSAAGATNVRFKYIIFRGNATIVNHKQTNPSTIIGHPNAEGAIAVGAMLYDNFPLFTPVWPSVASFSSRGGMHTKVGNTFIVRNKPEIIAPNGVNTTVNLGGAVFDDGDAYPNFFGTSASAPHAAAVAGLLIQGRKKYNLQTTVTPSEIRQQLQTSAGAFSQSTDINIYTGGYGYLQADSAIEQIANARPIIDSLKSVTPGAENGTEPFLIKVTGKYLTPDTKIYYYGKPMQTTVSADKTEALATIPPIPNGEDPPIQLYNPPKSESQLDGGLSEALHFFSEVIDITIRAENKTRKYGQDNPIFTAEILVNGIPLERTDLTLEELKLDNLFFNTVATSASKPGLYAIFPSRAVPLETDDPLLSQYGFTFVSGTLLIEKMPLKIIPKNKVVKYGEGIGDMEYTYLLSDTIITDDSIRNLINNLYTKYLADNALIVINGLDPETNPIISGQLSGMSAIASFQSIRNGRNFIIQNGKYTPVTDTLTISQLGEQRFLVDVSANSIENYLADSAKSAMVYADGEGDARAFLNIKALAAGNAQASIPNGQLQPMVNGQLQAMVNGQLQAIVNGQLQALVNGELVSADDIVFQNGQLLALVNGEWIVISNGQLQAVVNGQSVNIELTVLANGQLQAMVNGEEMQLVNGQLQAMVNGQLLAIVNGQLQALVNGQLMPLVNGQLLAMANGQLQPMVNGQLLAMVNGQLMALVNGELQTVQDLTISNGQLQAIVNGQLQAIVNGQLQAMVNGILTEIDTDDITLVNGQLQAIVNGQLQAMVNGQLQAMVNGQLQPLVNGDAIAADSVIQITNGQLQAMVNGTFVPIANGQLQALVNGQLLAMVNGQLMVSENGKVNFAVFVNGQLQAMVNGQLQAIVNGQLQAMVNGQLQDVESTTIVNGQLQAVVNGQTWTYANGQLLAIVNGQLQPLVNSFNVSGNNDNSKTLVLVDEDDITEQGGSIGSMFPVNMITSLDVGTQTLVPGAFLNNNYEVTYGLGEVEILPALLIAKADSTTKQYGDDNPEFSVAYFDFVYDDDAVSINEPEPVSFADSTTGVGNYSVVLRGGDATNYTLLPQEGNLEITPAPLTVTADNKTWIIGEPQPELTISYEGFKNNDNELNVCVPYTVPPSPVTLSQLERATTYSNVQINDASHVYQAQPGQLLTLTGSWYQVFIDPNNPYCPGCVTQLYIGMIGDDGVVLFSDCYDVSGLGDHSGIINKQFNAPQTPGVYYITQVSSWEYNCYDNGAGYPGNSPSDAFAVVVVNVENEIITATTTANEDSSPGNYPITLIPCNQYNPNYEVSLVEGTLTVSNATGGRSRISQPTEESIVKADKIYPNPTHGILRLEMQQELASLSDIQVFDVIGKQYLIKHKKINQGIYEIDVSGLSEGMYLLRIKQADKISTFKFIKR